MSSANDHRQVITFYSFKGGVGRTMTLANVAYRLAFHHGLHVIAVDWDLEAPGLQSFFRVPTNARKKARGLLDYFEVWETSYREQASELPDPLSYLVPVEPEMKEVSSGSLRLLIAGKQDEHYDARLGRFDWKRFYAESAGAGAVEHLRDRLAENADLVLVDSRTGLTDPGGICTIQIPDAVVLMTAPNKQSLVGIERIAHSIATATPEARVGRGTARIFLCMSRVPMVEETYQAREWFNAHKPWFNKGLDAGLWRREDHSLGLETHVIPQRGTYGFDEAIVGQAVGTLEREPLAQAYDKLTRVLLEWKWESVWRGSQTSETDVSTNLTQTKKNVARAKKSRNVVDLVYALVERAYALSKAKKLDEALVVAREAVALAEGLEKPSLLALVEHVHGVIQFDQKNYAAAQNAFEKSLHNAEIANDRVGMMYSRSSLGHTLIMLGQEPEGTRLMLDAIKDMRAGGHVQQAERNLAALHQLQILLAQRRENAALREDLMERMRATMQLYRRLGQFADESATIRDLLDFAQKYDGKLPDEAQLRQRLEELESPTPSPAPASPAKAKRNAQKN